MNDEDFSDLENELRSLRPKGPSSRLLAEIERELGATSCVALPFAAPRDRSSGLSVWERYAPLAMPVAAAVVFGLLAARFPGRSGTARTATPRADSADVSQAVGVEPLASYKPVSAETGAYASLDEGLVILADGSSARQWRDRYVDTITWRNPSTNASLQWSVPRDEVRVVPIRAY